MRQKKISFSQIGITIGIALIMFSAGGFFMTSKDANLSLKNTTNSTKNVFDYVSKDKNASPKINIGNPKVSATATINAQTAAKLAGSKYNAKLNSYIYYAQTDSNGKPTSDKWVVLVHGFMMNGKWMANSVGKMYLDKGINVLAIDLRGHGKSEGKVAMGYLESLDVWDWLTYLNSHYTVNEVFVHGVSLGGATTVQLSGLSVNGKTLKSQHVIGLIEDCGYSSMTSIMNAQLGGESEIIIKILNLVNVESLYALIGEGNIRDFLINVIGVGLTKENFSTLENGLNSLAKAELPLLIVHGNKDSMVPFSNSTRIYNTAQANKKIPFVDRYIAEGQEHAFITIGLNYDTYNGYVVNFIDKAEKHAGNPSKNKPINNNGGNSSNSSGNGSNNNGNIISNDVIKNLMSKLTLVTEDIQARIDLLVTKIFK